MFSCTNASDIGYPLNLGPPSFQHAEAPRIGLRLQDGFNARAIKAKFKPSCAREQTHSFHAATRS